MGTHTLSNSISAGITLTTNGTYLTPFTITQLGTINTEGGTAIVSSLSSASLINAGVVKAFDDGVVFTAGGSIINDSVSSTISGRYVGVFMSESNGTVVNDGTITATSSQDGQGVYLGNGYVNNSGLFSLIYGGNTGVRIYETSSASEVSTVMNSGTIKGNFAVDVGGSEGVIVNQGTIAGNASYTYSSGVVLLSGGSVTNSGTSSSIYGRQSGVEIFGSFGHVLNEGTISTGTRGGGIDVGAGGYIGNIGTSSLIDNGVFIGNAPGTIVNQGLISQHVSEDDAVQIAGSNAVGSVLNTGTILSDGSIAFGVDLNSGGYIGNLGKSALISAANSAIFIEGGSGTLQNGGTILGGIDLYASVSNLLIVNPGAVFVGGVDATISASNTLELSVGTHSGTLNMGGSFSGFSTIDFDAGATWTIEGKTSVLAEGQTIEGFATHDKIVLEKYTAKLNETTIAGNDITLTSSSGSATLDLFQSTAKNLILSDGGGNTTIAAVASNLTQTINSGAEEYLLSGATATSKIKAGGVEVVQQGATAKADIIAGGVLDLKAGGSLAGGVSFSTAATGGTLLIESTTLPGNTISGFIHGDTIQLAGITYNSSDTVTVATAGVVTIKTPSGNYNLNIAGAKVGATNYDFGPGSVLTVSADTMAVMGFLSPTETRLVHAEAAPMTGAAAALSSHLVLPLLEHGFLNFAAETPYSVGHLNVSLANFPGVDLMSFDRHFLL